MSRWLENLLKRLDSSRATYVIVSSGLTLRIIALAMVGASPLRNEAPGYYQMSLQLLRHENFSPYWPPGVPYFLWFFLKIFGVCILVARGSMIPLYGAFSLLLYLLVKEVSNRRAANLTALVFVFYPSYIRFSFNPSTEYPAAVCLLAIVYLLILVSRYAAFPLAAALGCFLGALTLIRPSSLLLVILTLPALFIKTRKITVALLALLVSLTSIAGWLWKAEAMTGRFIMINEANWENFFMGNNSTTPLYNTCPGGPIESGFSNEFKERLAQIRSQPQATREGLYRRTAFQHIASRPDLFLLRTLNRTRAYFGFPIHRGEPLLVSFRVKKAPALIGAAITILDVCFYWPIMILAILFLFNLKNSLLEADSALAILGTAILYALPYWVSCSQPRYNFPVVPLFAALAAMFVGSWEEKPAAAVFEPILHSVKRRRAMQFVLAAFFYMQIEWAWLAYSG